MKSLALTFMIFFFCGLTCAQTKPDGERDKLAGAVHMLRVETMKLSDEYARRQNGPRIPGPRLDATVVLGWTVRQTLTDQ